MSEVNMLDPVLEILQKDFVSRKLRFWPLVAQSDWSKYSVSCNELDDLPYVQINLNSSVTIKQFNKETFIDFFPYIQPLLEKYRGKLAVCGGFFTNPLRLGNASVDVDIFFHSCSEVEANEILKDCVVSMVCQYSSGIKKDRRYSRVTIQDAKWISTIRVERKLHITNVKLLLWKDSSLLNADLNEGREPSHRQLRYCITYQFIHRVYPNLGSILGGFDLGPSMVAYDGYDIWATEIGAWSLINGKFIVDISRRSTTFSARIKKYTMRGYGAILPGLHRKTLKNVQNNSKSLMISLFMEDNDIEFKCPGTHNGYNGECTNTIESHIPTEYVEILDFKFSIARYNPWGIRSNDLKTSSFKALQESCFNRESLPLSVPNVSDYGDGHGTTLAFIKDENRTALLHRYRESITAVITNDYLVNLPKEDVAKAYDTMIVEPYIPYNQVVVVESDKDSQFLQRKYAEYADRFDPSGIRVYLRNKKRSHVSKLDDFLAILNERCSTHMIEMREMLAGRVTWITSNPGRQWTSSVNPAVESASTYYGKYYISVYVGLNPQVESLLRLAKIQKGNVWFNMPRDIFNHIIAISLTI